MQQGKQSTSAFLLLHGERARVVPMVRLDDRKVSIEIERNTTWIHPDFDPRDQRTVLVFDGAIPAQGVPRAGRVAVARDFWFSNNAQNTRSTSRSEEWPMPSNLLPDGGGGYNLHITRYVIIVPASEIVLCRFRPENFGLQYVFAEIRRRGEYSQVTWRFHSP